MKFFMRSLAENILMDSAVPQNKIFYAVLTLAVIFNRLLSKQTLRT